MDKNKVLEEIMIEYNMKLQQIEREFGTRIFEFQEEDDWSDTEIMAYDLGFAKALMIIIDILKENGVE